MAVTIHQTPDDFTPSDNPVVWTFSSDMTDEDNFVYLVQVYVNDVTHSINLIYPESGSVARFDASSIASYVTQQPALTDLVFQDAENYARIKIQVKERYGDPPADEASVTSDNIVVFKAGMTNEDFVEWDSSDYVIGTTDKKFLTNFPRTTNPKVRLTDEQIRLMLIHDGTGFTARFKTYEADGTLIATMSSTFTPGSNKKILILNVTPDVLLADFGSGDEFDDCAYYTVSSDTLFETYQIDIDTECKQKRSQRIHFMGDFGSIESFTFNAVSYETGSIESRSYQKGFGEFDGNNFDFNLQSGTNIDHAKILKRKLVVESDWLDEDVQQWLVSNLYTSAAVYHEVGSDLIRRMIEESGYKKMYHDTNMLFREKISLRLPTKTSAKL